MGHQIAAQTIDFTAESLKLSQALAAAEKKALDIRNIIRAQEGEAKRLRDRIADLGKQTQRDQEEHTIKLRFPKERPLTKNIFSVICRYDRIYPLYNGDLSKNNKSISWTSNPLDDSDTAVPMREKGVDPAIDKEVLVSLFRELPHDDMYVAFYVYTDSFGSYRSAREAALAAGLEIGWEPVLPGRELRFGKEGHAPPPL